jgi:twitching motility protein PilU
VAEIKEIMKRSRDIGMQTFDQHLFELFDNDQVSYEDAIRNADSMNDLRLMIKLNSKDSKGKDMAAGLNHLEIMK